MRLLDRYLLRELLVPLGFCLSGFLLLWVSSDLISELGSFQEKKLLPGEIVEYYLVKMPSFIVIILPIALLLALLYALTNHARHHEITAIRAAGVSLWRLSLPYFLVGLICSLVLFALNEFWVPDSDEKADRIENRHKTENGQTSKRAVAQDKIFNRGFNNARDQRI
ncbi:MAG TPA: LptF/LptG family permease, partial [Clostridia bacterium]|nr:LptF/LptG family permease [Clostridia bacterium]